MIEIKNIYFDQTHLEAIVFIDIEGTDDTHDIEISDTYELHCSWDYSHCERGEEGIEGTDLTIEDVYVWSGGHYEEFIDRFLLTANNPIVKRVCNDANLAEYITEQVAQQAGNIAGELEADRQDYAYDIYRARD